MHSIIGVHIQTCDWQALGTQLWSDKHNLPRCFGEEQYLGMQKALEVVEDRYFLELGSDESVLNTHAIQLYVHRTHGQTAIKGPRKEGAKEAQREKDKGC